MCLGHRKLAGRRNFANYHNEYCVPGIARRARLAVYITDLCSRSPYGSPWTGRDEDLARLVDVPNVEDITFDRQFARPSAFAFLPKMKSLRALYFTLGCVVTDELVRIISQCRGIERVVVLVGDVSDDGARSSPRSARSRRCGCFRRAPRTRGWRPLARWQTWRNWGSRTPNYRCRHPPYRQP